MKFCFDMDDTLTVAPRVLGEMMASLKKNGHQCFILTGSLGEAPGEVLEAYRKNQATSLGLGSDHFDDIVICVAPTYELVGEMKGKFCSDAGIDFMIDDSPTFIRAIKAGSPKTFMAAVV